MRRSRRRHNCKEPCVPLLRGGGLRLLVSLLALFIWSGSPEKDVQRTQGSFEGQGTLAATKSVAHRTILARKIARYAGAETYGSKPAGYLDAGKRDGKPFGVVAESLPPFQPARDAPLGAWSDTRPELYPVHAFDARAPPILPA
jgi:hypothetical protein